MQIKTIEQQKLEQRHDGAAVKEIIIDTFKGLRGESRLIAKAAVRLEISSQTLRNWCADMDIKIEDYRG